MNQAVEAHTAERRELIEKNETDQNKLNQLERQIITMENQIES